MSSKKYQSDVQQDGDKWLVRITRQVTSRKSMVSKEQGDFTSEADARTWAEETLAEFISTQKSANSRQGLSRKDQQEVKRQRSSRRAEKTEAAKREKEKALANQQSDGPSDSHSEFEGHED